MYLFICKYTSINIYPMIFWVALHVVSKGMKILHNPEDDSLRQQYVSEGLAFTTSEGGESNVRLGIDVEKSLTARWSTVRKQKQSNMRFLEVSQLLRQTEPPKKKNMEPRPSLVKGGEQAGSAFPPILHDAWPQAREAGIQLFFVNF